VRLTFFLWCLFFLSFLSCRFLIFVIFLLEELFETFRQFVIIFRVLVVFGEHSDLGVEDGLGRSGEHASGLETSELVKLTST